MCVICFIQYFHSIEINYSVLTQFRGQWDLHGNLLVKYKHNPYNVLLKTHSVLSTTWAIIIIKKRNKLNKNVYLLIYIWNDTEGLSVGDGLRGISWSERVIVGATVRQWDGRPRWLFTFWFKTLFPWLCPTPHDYARMIYTAGHISHFVRNLQLSK